MYKISSKERALIVRRAASIHSIRVDCLEAMVISARIDPLR